MKVQNSLLDIKLIKVFLPWFVMRYALHIAYFAKFRQLVETDLQNELEIYGGPKYDSSRSVIRNLPAICWGLNNDPFFLTVFYWRLGRRSEKLALLKRDHSSLYIGTYDLPRNIRMYHPFSSIINAKHIGEGFEVRHNTTLGNTHDDNSKLPTLGNNVKLGAGVTIIGDITIGDNVIVGANTLINKDVPSDCVVVGNPFRIIRTL